MAAELTWNGNTVIIPTYRKVEGAIRESQKQIDFDYYRIKRGGMLEESLRTTAFPVEDGFPDSLTRVLEATRNNSVLIRYLNSPTSQLDQDDIRYFLQLLGQQLISSYSHYKAGSLRVLRHGLIYFLLRNTVLLKDGIKIKSVRDFRQAAQLPEQPPPEPKSDMVSEQYDPGAATPEERAPISAIRHNSYDELLQKSQVHVENKNQRLEDCYMSEINQFLEWQDKIRELRVTPLPNWDDKIAEGYLPNSGTVVHYKMDAEKIVHFYARLYQYHQAHKFANFQQLWKQMTVKGIGKRRLLAKFPNIAEYETHGWQLADYYLPARIAYCCRSLLQLWFALNKDTANQLSADDLEPWDDGGYILTPLKGKTGQLQSIHIGKDELNKIKVLRLLKKNDNNIKDYWQYWQDEEGHNALIVSYMGNRYFPYMGKFASHDHHSRFIKKHELSNFKPDDLRDQKLNTTWLKTGDVTAVQAEAGHKNLGSTEIYLNQNINFLLNEANMHEFMQRLGASIVWAVHADDKNPAQAKDAEKIAETFKKIGVKMEDVDKKLLFPIAGVRVSKNYLSAECDEWLAKEAEKLVITMPRILQTARQLRYYKANWQRLYSDNPEQFKREELPRIIFCRALIEAIKAQGYVDVYEEIEQRLIKLEKKNG